MSSAAASSKKRIDLNFLKKLNSAKEKEAAKVPMYMNVTLDDKSEIFIFQIKLTNSVGGLRKYIGRRYGCSAFQIALTANSRVLLNHQTIGQSGLSQNSIIECQILDENDDEAERLQTAELDRMTCVSHCLRPINQKKLISFDLKDMTKSGCISFYKMSLPRTVKVDHLRRYVAQQLGKREDELVLKCLSREMKEGTVSNFIIEGVEGGTTVECSNLGP